MLRRRLRVPADTLKDTRGLTRRSSPFFTVRVRVNDLGHPRFAVTVSTKVDRRATVRHSLKRRVTSRLSRLHGGSGAGPPGRPGHDIIISVHPRARDLPRKEFYAELDKLL